MPDLWEIWEGYVFLGIMVIKGVEVCISSEHLDEYVLCFFFLSVCALCGLRSDV